MALTHRSTSSGLVLAEEAMDEAALSRALKQIRPDVTLQKRPVDEAKGGTLVYKVVHVESGLVMFTWTDAHGRPLPLSSGLLDEFQRHQLGARNSGLVSDDEHNRRLVEQRERMLAEELAAVREEHMGRLTDRVSVSMAGRHRPRKLGNSPDGPRATPWRRRA